MMGWVECDKKNEVGEILYWHSVVGDNTYYIDTKMGGRTSLFLTSQRMPSRYGGACDFM